jgi:3',5'-cyclic AMP phosphodiesterase CpdA
VQLAWSHLAAGPHEVAVGPTSVVVDGDGGPAATWVEGLPPASTHEVAVDGRPAGSCRTLPKPNGPRLGKVATISDIHVGQHELGRFPRFYDIPNERCVAAAVAEIAAWQPDLLVVKGDLTEHGYADEWPRIAAILGDARAPVVATVGNHDIRYIDAVDGTADLAAAGVELTRRGGIMVRDVPGVRVIVADTTTGHNVGSFARVGDAVVEAAAATSGGVLLTVHHHLMPWPVPYHWPPGIPRADWRGFVRRLHAANPNVLITSGHTHRHRARRRGRVPVTEVGAVRDFPGVWGAYESYESGLVQTVRRIGAPDVLRWTDDTARTAAGMWRRWSPGRLRDRCFTLDW